MNPGLDEKGLAVFFNPLDRTVKKKVKLPLYYTGLTERALVCEQEGEARTYTLDRHYEIHLPVEVEPHSVTWFLIQ